jgi:hypothetical protein
MSRGRVAVTEGEAQMQLALEASVSCGGGDAEHRSRRRAGDLDQHGHESRRSESMPAHNAVDGAAVQDANCVMIGPVYNAPTNESSFSPLAGPV